MKDALRGIYLSIAIFVCQKVIIPILYVIDALYARRRYRKLIKQTGQMYNQYIYTKNLFFLEGGYETNKEQIVSRSKILKHNAELVGEAIGKLNTEWSNCFTENTKKMMQEQLEVLKEIQEFGENNCQIEGT